MTYADVVLADSPAGYWRLGEASGTTAADEVGAHAGTIGAGVTLGAAGALGGSGDTDTAATFNGGGSGVVATTGWTLPSTLTLEGWVKLSTSVPSLHQALIGLAASGSVRLGLHARRNASGNRVAVWDNVRGWRESTVSLSLDAWHHIAAVFDGSDVSFYVDGAFVNTVTTGPIGTTYTMVSIGASQNSGTDPLRGDIDEPAIYTRALSAAEIAEHYAAGTTPASEDRSGGSTAVVTVTAEGSGVGPPGPLTDLTYPAYVSHRGGEGIHPQNTMTAFTQPVNASPMILETDIHVLASDGTSTIEQRMALAHDPQVADTPLYESDGVTPASGSLFDTTRATFITYRVPWPDDSAAPVPTSMWEELADYLITAGQATLIEPKHGGAVSAIIDSVAARGLRQYVLANSFNYDQCVTFAAAGLHTQWMTTTFATNSAATVKAAGIDHVAWQAGTSGFAAYVSAAHAAGLKVWVYTITSRTQADDYLSQGADGIITSRPDLVGPEGQSASGGSTSAVTVTTAGAGAKAARDGSAATATATPAAAGHKVATGGSTAATGVTTSGAGRRTTGSGSTATTTASATGSGRKVARAGTVTLTTAQVTGAGWKAAIGGQVTTVTTTATGAGLRVEAGQGGSTTVVTATATGAGVAYRAGGSTTTVTVTVHGAGQPVTPGGGGSTADVTATASGAGMALRRGGATTTITAAATGSGRDPDAGRDITITLTGLTLHPARVATLTLHPARVTSLTAHPLRVTRLEV